MSIFSRMDRLIGIIGGEDNLPPKQAQVIESTHVEDSSATSQAGSDASTDPPPVEEWWKNLPVVTYAPSPEEHSEEVTTVTREPLHHHHHHHHHHQPDVSAPAPPGMTFCPFLAVTRFCYMFVSSQWKQPLASAFFDAGKIFQRNWDIYYVWSPYYVTPKPTILVPEDQVVRLLKAINDQFPGAQVSITKKLRAQGFVSSFDQYGDAAFSPVYLGQCTLKPQYEDMVNRVKHPNPVPEGTVPERTLEGFKAHIDNINRVAKQRKEADKKKNFEAQLLKRRTMSEELLVAQRYLGLAPEKEESSLPDVSSLTISPININNPPPYKLASDVVFICVDVEANELNMKQITEVGLAILSMRDLQNVAPGETGIHWQKLIRAHHIRIDEYRSIVNRKFVSGCPDRFEFGTSEFVPKDNTPQALNAIFRESLGTDDKPQGSSKGKSPAAAAAPVPRVVLVGHDVSGDISYLRSAGFDLSSRSDIIGTLDTGNLYRAHTRDPNMRSLASILCDFDFAGFNLHNAGNDAVYTMWVLLAIAVRGAAERGSEAERERLGKIEAERKAAAVGAAERQAGDDFRGWEAEIP